MTLVSMNCCSLSPSSSESWASLQKQNGILDGKGFNNDKDFLWMFGWQPCSYPCDTGSKVNPFDSISFILTSWPFSVLNYILEKDQVSTSFSKIWPLPLMAVGLAGWTFHRPTIKLIEAESFCFASDFWSDDIQTSCCGYAITYIDGACLNAFL